MNQLHSQTATAVTTATPTTYTGSRYTTTGESIYLLEYLVTKNTTAHNPMNKATVTASLHATGETRVTYAGYSSEVVVPSANNATATNHTATTTKPIIPYAYIRFSNEAITLKQSLESITTYCDRGILCYAPLLPGIVDDGSLAIAQQFCREHPGFKLLQYPLPIIPQNSEFVFEHYATGKLDRYWFLDCFYNYALIGLDLLAQANGESDQAWLLKIDVDHVYSPTSLGYAHLYVEKHQHEADVIFYTKYNVKVNHASNLAQQLIANTLTSAYLPLANSATTSSYADYTQGNWYYAPEQPLVRLPNDDIMNSVPAQFKNYLLLGHYLRNNLLSYHLGDKSVRKFIPTKTSPQKQLLQQAIIDPKLWQGRLRFMGYNSSSIQQVSFDSVKDHYDHFLVRLSNIALFKLVIELPEYNIRGKQTRSGSYWEKVVFGNYARIDYRHIFLSSLHFYHEKFSAYDTQPVTYAIEAINAYQQQVNRHTSAQPMSTTTTSKLDATTLVQAYKQQQQQVEFQQPSSYEMPPELQQQYAQLLTIDRDFWSAAHVLDVARSFNYPSLFPALQYGRKAARLSELLVTDQYRMSFYLEQLENDLASLATDSVAYQIRSLEKEVLGTLMNYYTLPVNSN